MRLLSPVALSALLAASCGGGAADGPRPNVLLVTLDTTRPDHMGCYGGAAATPHLDGLAASGVRFERAISTAGITPMSHASILTGLNNYRHGMRVFHSEECSHRLKDEVDTLPELLGAQGYRTAASISAYPVSEYYNLHQGFETFATGVVEAEELDLSRQQRHETEWSSDGRTEGQRRGDFTVADALAWLDEEGTAGDPWCLWVHFFDVHDYSVVPPRDYVARLGIEMPAEGTRLRGEEMHLWRERIYDAELTWMDEQVGRLLSWLREHGQEEDTIVVVTADHGQGLEEGRTRHGWPKHRLLYDWSIRVPLLVRLPGGPAGAVVADQVRTIDILPTVLEALDIGARQEMEGASLLALANGGREDAPRLAYADALNLYDAHSPKERNLPPGQYDNLFCVTDGRWKLIWHERFPHQSQLYDLASDPEELANLYRPAHPEVERLQAFLEERGAMEVEPPDAASRAADAANAAKLEALGYGGGGHEDEEAPPDPGGSPPPPTEGGERQPALPPEDPPPDDGDPR